MTDKTNTLDPAALDAWLEERQRLCDAATKGPWSEAQAKANAAFITDARTSLPTALGIIRGLRERVAVLEARATTAEAALRKSEAALAEERRTTDQLKSDLRDAPHHPSCKSRYMVDDTPWDEFKSPVCRSINGCGHCEKCEWRKTRPPFRHLPCNCWKSALKGIV